MSRTNSSIRPIVTILFILSSMLWSNKIKGQPMICPDPPMMTSFCKDACIICDIDGFTGRNSNPEDGEAPPDFCTTTVHNGQWIAFIAGTKELSIRLNVSNCNTNWGLEIGIYEGIDCDNYKLVSNCDGDVGSSQVFTAENLTIGQYYYLVMDGNGGDMCDWTFTVLEGDTRVNPLPSSGVIQGNFEACPNVEKTFVLDYPVGATEFLWEVNEVDQFQNDPELTIAFPETGVYNVCVTAFNACETAPPTCQQVLVKIVPPTDFGKKKICLGDNFEINDSILTERNFYEFHIPLENGCDSVVTVDLEVVAPSFTDYGRVNICTGDALPIGNKTFSEPGFYTEVLTNQLGCDSTVTLDLFTVECNIRGNIESNTTICQGTASGSIQFSVINGTPPFEYRWERIDKLLNGTGRIEKLLEKQTIDNLLAGTYLITITDNFDEFENVLILFDDVPEPPKLTLQLTPSDYNGYTNACTNSSDGAITALPEGGLPPYNYQWNNGNTQANITDLAPSIYAITLTDDLGCEQVDSVLLEGPLPLSLEASFINSSCEGLNTGRILPQSIGGGVPPFEYSLDGENYISETEFSNLSIGNYTLTTRDANNCTVVDTGRLTAPIIPVVDLGEDKEVKLADGIALTPLEISGANTATWRQDIGLSCYDCLKTVASPLNLTTYLLTATSVDNCTTIDSITIRVKKIRDVYAPNVFSPNSDGINDIFFLFGGPEVRLIKSFQVFSRWGELVFEQKEFLPNDQAFGWNGLMANGEREVGVFVWSAEIEFIDNVSLVYAGDITLIR